MNARLTIGLCCLCLLFFCARVLAMAEEDFGNGSLNSLNYSDFPDIMPVIDDVHRVYRIWCNGNEQLYFAGDAAALNTALRLFAVCKAQSHMVVLRPGPSEVGSLDKKSTRYNWSLHLIGGLVRGDMAHRNQAALIWNPDPVLTISVDDQLDLAKLKIPAGVEVVGVRTLAKQFRDALSSSDDEVRGWGCGELTELDPYSRASETAVRALLKDSDKWVRENAALNVPLFTTADSPERARHEATADRIDHFIDELRRPVN